MIISLILGIVFVILSVKDSFKEEMVIKVCNVLKIEYINEYRRVVIDSLISFQIENFVKSKENRNKLNEVVGMQMSVEELFVQTEREYEFDSGFNKGITEGKKEVQEQIILNMLNDSMDDETIQKLTNCSEECLQEIKRKFLAGK